MKDISKAHLISELRESGCLTSTESRGVIMSEDKTVEITFDCEVIVTNFGRKDEDPTLDTRDCSVKTYLHNLVVKEHGETIGDSRKLDECKALIVALIEEHFDTENFQ